MKKTTQTTVLLLIAGVMLLSLWLEGAQNTLAGDVVRLHVLANSDSEADQTLKLAVRDRVLAEAAPLLEGVSDRDAAWQTMQSLYAIGSGGIMGQGFGNSRQKHLFLPEPQNDFIFSIVCEELGFIGAVLILVLFLILVWRGFVIASHAPDKFGFMLAVGLTVQIAIQVAINVAVVSNLLPNTGISLPFFSYGGSSLVMLLGQMGILLSISRHRKKK